MIKEAIIGRYRDGAWGTPEKPNRNSSVRATFWNVALGHRKAREYKGTVNYAAAQAGAEINKELNQYYSTLPNHLQDGMRLYIERGVSMASFGDAVVRNDLKEACSRADHINQHQIFNIVKWLYNHAPAACWGSNGNVDRWTTGGGLNGGA